jgi:hypothetical protein
VDWVKKILFQDVLFWIILGITGLQIADILSVDDDNNILQIKYNI